MIVGSLKEIEGEREENQCKYTVLLCAILKYDNTNNWKSAYRASEFNN